MTRVLLDTHALLWWHVADPRLSARARQLIADPATEVLISAATGWEIAIKAALGTLTLQHTPEDLIRREVTANGLRELPIEMRHATRVYDLPQLHKDPFDRLLIAQALVENLPILTNDPQFKKYGVSVEW
jgi:PIN domain nuclease of toxin-antitoxin system